MAAAATSTSKQDPNREIFQMRAQEKKAEICKQMWQDRWSWLFEENKRSKAESKKILEEMTASLPRVAAKPVITKSLKPVPVTSSGFVGWLAAKPECRLERFTSNWLLRIPVKAPDAWHDPNYLGPASK